VCARTCVCVCVCAHFAAAAAAAAAAAELEMFGVLKTLYLHTIHTCAMTIENTSLFYLKIKPPSEGRGILSPRKLASLGGCQNHKDLEMLGVSKKCDKV